MRPTDEELEEWYNALEPEAKDVLMRHAAVTASSLGEVAEAAMMVFSPPSTGLDVFGWFELHDKKAYRARITKWGHRL